MKAGYTGLTYFPKHRGILGYVKIVTHPWTYFGKHYSTLKIFGVAIIYLATNFRQNESRDFGRRVVTLISYLLQQNGIVQHGYGFQGQNRCKNQL